MIKFRAWVHCLNKMMPVKEIDFDDFMPSVMVEINSERHEQMFFENTDYPDCELMQYTGLKDKNGQEIYEGDILGRQFYVNAIVSYDDGAFEQNWNCHRKHRLDQDFCSSREVIGNIFEDGDLIDG